MLLLGRCFFSFVYTLVLGLRGGCFVARLSRSLDMAFWFLWAGMRGWAGLLAYDIRSLHCFRVSSLGASWIDICGVHST